MTKNDHAAPLELAEVTLIAVTSINLAATIAAIEASQKHIRFGAAKLLTHEPLRGEVPDLEVVTIPQLTSARAYSQFMLGCLADHVATSHCLVMQWDGYPLHPENWEPRFLEYDYIGASWPQFGDGHDVGNGGFSLRSRRLLEACRNPQFTNSHPEDVAICRRNRPWLEAQGLRFAPRAVADAFSAERASHPDHAFGFHGVWHMPTLVGADNFWNCYRQLDDRKSVYHDLGAIMAQMIAHPRGLSRCMILAWDKLREARSSGKNNI
jgi:hypothetical protein